MKQNLPSLKALRAVEAVGRHGSITSAGTELNVTPGAVSRHVTLLEHYFDCKLFRRHAAGLALTEVGRLYVDRLTEAFGLIDQASSQLLRSGERKTLVIRALGAFAAEWLLPRIGQFENAHPEIEVSVRGALRGVDFHTDDADVAIIWSEETPKGVESTKLYTPYFTPIVSAALLEGKPAIRSASDLKHFKLLHTTQFRPSWDQWLSKVAPGHGLNTSHGYWLERPSQINHAVRQGVGVGLGQHLLVGDELVSGSLVAPLNQMLRSSMSIYLVWPKQKTNRPETLRFRDWLIGAIATAHGQLACELPHLTCGDVRTFAQPPAKPVAVASTL